MNLEVKTKQALDGKSRADIVFVHGAWHGAWCWEENFMEYFAQRGYTNHALNLRGHGGDFSSEILQSTRISDYVDDVLSLTEILKGSPILIGHSMGGFIIQKYLEKYHAKAAILLASVPQNGALNLNLRFLIKHPNQYLKVHTRRCTKILLEEDNFIKNSLFETLEPDKQAYYFKQMQNEPYAVFWDMLILDLPDVSKIRTPMLVLGAENDYLVRPHQVKKTAKVYNADSFIFPKMGHDMMLDADWETVAAKITDWLNKCLLSN